MQACALVAYQGQQGERERERVIEGDERGPAGSERDWLRGDQKRLWIEWDWGEEETKRDRGREGTQWIRERGAMDGERLFQNGGQL